MEPMRIYLFEEGLARLCTNAYSTNPKHLRDKYSHLTNFSINSKSENFQANADADEDGVGNKWSLSALMRHLASRGVDCASVMASIQVGAPVFARRWRGVRVRSCCRFAKPLGERYAPRQGHSFAVSGCSRTLHFLLVAHYFTTFSPFTARACTSLSTSPPLSRT